MLLDGTPHCWGSQRDGRSTPPQGQRFVQVASGSTHTAGITASGAFKCWGDNSMGQCPSDDSMRYSQISAGGGFTCGIIEDTGFLRCWGGTPQAGNTLGIGPFAMVAAGGSHVCAVTREGFTGKTSPDVLCSGNNAFGVCDVVDGYAHPRL